MSAGEDVAVIRKRQRAVSTLRIVSLFIERICTLVLAILLLRVHMQLAKEQSLASLPEWMAHEFPVTIAIVVLLAIAFILSIAAESIVLEASEKAGIVLHGLAYDALVVPLPPPQS